jgi:hypothetical protein
LGLTLLGNYRGLEGHQRVRVTVRVRARVRVRVTVNPSYP